MRYRFHTIRDAHPLSAERYTTIAFVAKSLLFVVVFTGAAVRLTGSGLGCPTWPECTASSIYASLNTHGVIEFTSRVLTSFVAAGAIAAWLRAFFRVPPPLGSRLVRRRPAATARA